MAKITRKDQKVFGGSLVATNNIAKFGSLKVGSPAYSTDPDDIQTAEFLNGWSAALVANQAPAIQDMNALFLLLSRQIAYLIQTGVAEWNATTTYYIGSVVSDGYGNTYKSLTDTNLNHAVTDSTYWSMSGGQVPVGGVIPIVYGYADYTSGAWAPPATTAIKDGYMLCDGASIPGTATLKGKTPILNDSRFLQGNVAGSVGAIASSSATVMHTHGTDSQLGAISLSVSGSTTLPNHVHSLSNAGGAKIDAFAGNSGGNTNFIYIYKASSGRTFTSAYYEFCRSSNDTGATEGAGGGTANSIGLEGATDNPTSNPGISFTSTGTTASQSHSHTTNSQSVSASSCVPKYMNCVFVVRVQ